MNASTLRAAGAGALATAALVAFALRPGPLAPAPTATPQLDLPPPEAVPPTAAAAGRPLRKALVYVAGAVARPGVYPIGPEDRALDAVAKAGGLARDADPVAVNLAAHVADGDEIAVPRIGESEAGPSRSGERRTRGAHRSAHGQRRRRPAAGDAADGDVPVRRLDLNAADAAALASLPGIGATLAERIVAFRALNGPFASVDGLADVAGITPARLDALAPYLTVGQP